MSAASADNKTDGKSLVFSNKKFLLIFNAFFTAEPQSAQRGGAATKKAFNPPQINIKKGLTGQADYADYADY